MNDEQINLSPAEANKMRRNISALQKSIRDMHALRDKINTALSRVHAENLDLALTQKKNLKLLSSQYDTLSQQVACLPPLDAAQVLEDEYNYILTIGNIIEIADTMRWRFEPQNWRKALSRLIDNPIAHAALSVRQNVARWVEKDARAADRVIKREVKSVRKELGALAAEAQQMRKSGKQLESERASGRPESRSKGVDR